MSLPGNVEHPELRRLDSFHRIMILRHRVLQAIRSFFSARGFLEVETPVRQRAPAPELHIDAEPSGSYFLRTSPELHMKRLLAAGYPQIFQMGPCFRRDERGPLHRPEYTMLEWYRANAGYADMLADTKALIHHLIHEVVGKSDVMYQGRALELLPVWERITVSEAFRLHAGWDPCENFDADRFDLDLVSKVEPRLPRNVPVILTDYPKEAASLARIRPDAPPVAERWELYIAGIEIANAYSELNDPGEQRMRFDDAVKRRRELGKDVYPPDDEFLELLKYMPPSGGIALGVDRLVMILADAGSLDEVIPFRE